MHYACIVHHMNIAISTTLKTYSTDKQGILFLQFSLRTLTFSALSRACLLPDQSKEVGSG